jgi:diguanylate cyclase (GGDEF)-like protein
VACDGCNSVAEVTRLLNSPDCSEPEPGASAGAEAALSPDQSPNGPDLDAAQSLVDNAKDLYEHDPVDYLERVSAVLDRVRTLGRIDLEVQLTYYQGCAADVLGRFEEGYAAMKRADELASTLSDPFWQGKTAGGLGGILVGRGDSTGAIEQLERSLPLRRAANDRQGEATSLNNLGFAYLSMHGFENRAVELFEKARRIWIEVGDLSDGALALSNIACGELSLADRLWESDQQTGWQAAERAFAAAQQAYLEADQQQIPRISIDARIACAGAATRLARTAEAVSQLETAGDLLSRFSSVGLQIEWLLALGRVLRVTGAGSDAVARLREAERLAVDNDRPIHRARALSELSLAQETDGDIAGSLKTFRLYHQLSEQLRDRAAERQAEALNSRLALERAEHAAEVERLRAVWLEEQNRTLSVHALQDGLTGLPNRRAFDGRLREFIARGRESRALALADIDHFKAINDRHSHLIGDDVLRRLGQVLRGGVRDLDFAARFGGEEFALLFVDVDAARAQAACERLRELVAAQPWNELTPDLQVSISVGLAMIRPGEDAMDALTRADRALYLAKSSGRNRLVADDRMSAAGCDEAGS